MINDSLRSVLRACHSGLDTVTLRKELALRIAPVIPFDAFAFSTTDPDIGLITHTVADGVPADMMLAYCSHFYPQHAATIVMDAAWTEHPIFSLWKGVPGLESAMHARGLRYDVHVSLADRRGYWGDWCIMREMRCASAEAELQFLKRILPHVTSALRTAALIDAAHAAPRGDASTGATCVVVLDARGRLVLRAGDVDTILEDLADVGVASGDRVPASMINLASRVRSGINGSRPDATPEALLRVRGNSGCWYTMRAMLSEPDARGDSASVVVVRPMALREKAVLLTRLYGLSQREREVTAAIARGESTKRIATGLRISPHTVKEHLDRACAKIGVRGRKALVARLFLDMHATPQTGGEQQN